jgi:hypothetical protein
LRGNKSEIGWIRMWCGENVRGKEEEVKRKEERD